MTHRSISLLTLATWFAVCGSPAPAHAQTDEPPELRYEFREQWRHGAPAFAREEFPERTTRDPVLFLGRMKPRGMLVLRAPGDLEATPPAQRRVLRSPTVDITPLLSLAGAHHQPPGGQIRFVPAAELPPLSVRYDPELPATIEVPAMPGTCVLLFEIGEAEADAWAPGLWNVKLRFDASSLNGRLTAAGLSGVPDPARPAGTAVILEVKFLARPVLTPDDEVNFSLFQYEDARSTADGASQAILALDSILAAYPTDGNLRFARADLLSQSGRIAEALSDARLVLEQAEANQLRARFVPPARVLLNREEALEWLRLEISAWESTPP